MKSASVADKYTEIVWCKTHFSRMDIYSTYIAVYIYSTLKTKSSKFLRRRETYISSLMYRIYKRYVRDDFMFVCTEYLNKVPFIYITLISWDWTSAIVLPALSYMKKINNNNNKISRVLKTALKFVWIILRVQIFKPNLTNFCVTVVFHRCYETLL